MVSAQTKQCALSRREQWHNLAHGMCFQTLVVVVGGQDYVDRSVAVVGAQDGTQTIYQDWLQAPEFTYVFFSADGLQPHATYIVVIHFAGQPHTANLPY